MLDILIKMLTAIDIIVALLLIPLILVQQTKDGGFGSAFGGMGESVFGVHAASHLAKLTVILASAFLVVTLTLTVLTGHRNAPKKGVLEKETQISAESSTTAPETAGKTPESQEVLPDGTIVKKVEGGTITMKPASPDSAQVPPPQPPSPSDAQLPSPLPGTVSVNPAPQSAKSPDAEEVEQKPDGTIVRKVKGGTITMKPVKENPATGNPLPSGTQINPDGSISKTIKVDDKSSAPEKDKKPDTADPGK